MAAEHAFKAILGIALILAGIYLLAAFWWSDFLILLKGTIPVILIALGLIFLLLGFEK
ncbi:MAG TPA: hypothetical protein VFE88_00840 [Candidatus Nanoarchaeia archaeon]|nr:hypothetical protein [Candidatus Nanoarchaeia archaeon]